MRSFVVGFVVAAALLTSASAQTKSDPLGDASEQVFLAAFEQGKRELSAGLANEALASFATARANVAAASGDIGLAQAELLTHEAAALMYVAMQIGSTHNNVRDEDVAAHEKLHEAMRAMAPSLREADTPGAAMTPRVRAYAAARAWHALLDSRHGQRLRPWRNEEGIPTLARPPERYCPVRLIARPMPRYPRSAMSGNRVGAVAVRLHFNAEGEYVLREVAASAPNREEFVEAVETAMSQWRAEWDPDAPPGCTRAYVLTTTIGFAAPG
jgi:hypothetical protein